MAKRLGLSKTSYAAFEIGARCPRLVDAVRLSRELGSPIEELFPGLVGPMVDQQAR